MKAILIVNMGGPLSEKDMEFFLLKMFNDKRIIGAPKLIRKFIANKITRKRYKKSWEKYQLIGGTPIIKNTELTAKELIKHLPKEYLVDFAFSYSNPLIYNTIEKLADKGATEIKIIALYPQESFTTTKSVEDDMLIAAKNFPKIKISMNGNFSDNTNFINFWVEIIQNHIKENNLQNPLLIYSAHSIPQYLVEKGDKYGENIERSAKLISEKLNLKYKVCYQSKIGKLKWLGPDTKESISEMSPENEIIFVPISFVSENLETLYDIECEIIPFAKETGKFNHISRIKIPVTHELMTKTILDLI